jgi:23S rRNA pseudouridine2605 synthase
MNERVQKILAKAGLGSRRACEVLISSQRVKVNGQSIKLGDKADPDHDQICVDGKKIESIYEKVYIALNKPRGVLSDMDPLDTRTTVFDLIPKFPHLFSVGRLDFNSEGLILMTNDGELANHLTHPRYGHEKEYSVFVTHQPDEEQLQAWRKGVVIENWKKTLPAKVSITKIEKTGAWLKIIMKEGRKRQIREVGKVIGLPVNRIIRTRINTLELENLKPRQWRFLTKNEISQLKDENIH